MPPGKRKATGGPGPRPLAPAAPGSPRFLPCPTCGKSFVTRILQQHAWGCVEEQQQKGHQQQQSLPSNNSAVRNGKNDAEGKFVHCPICSRAFPHHAIEAHAWGCLPPTQQRENAALPVLSSSGEGAAPAPPAVANTALVGAGEKETSAEKEQAQGCISGKDGCVSAQLHGGAGASEAASTTTSSGRTAAVSVRVTVPPTTDGYQGGNAVQRLMEGGKRAVEVEREAKVVPPTWPVERLEDVLPCEKADSLLACLLQASRSWTSHPWFNNNGVEGTTHTRSHIYRIPTVQGSLCSISDPDWDHTKSNGSQRRAGSLPTTESPTAAESSGSHGCARAVGGEDGGGTRMVSTRGTDDGEFKLTKDGEIGHNDLFESAEGDAVATPSLRRSYKSVKLSEGGMQGSASDSEAEHSQNISTSQDRRAASEELMRDNTSDLAPEELLQIVPHVVQVVRRRQQQRLEAGLSGREGLNWNPNFCICHVYDNHGSHIGAHSDTLSEIGPQAIVAAVSLGAKRVFVVQEMLPWGVKAPPAGDGNFGGKKFVDMPHNSAIVMWAGCQERYKHSVPAMPKGVGTHPMAGTKRISVTLRERRETLPSYLLPVPDCRCGLPAKLKARVLGSGRVEYLYQCDPGQGQCGFTLFKGPSR